MAKTASALLGFVLLAAIAGRAAAQDVPWRIGRWNPDSFGNQRVVLHVGSATPSGAVRALIGWRRRDTLPEMKRLILTDDRGVRINNLVALRVTRDSGDIAFEPVRGAGDYFLYYLPYTGSVKSNYPRITYPKPDSTAAPGWLASVRSGTAALPRAAVTAFEAVDTLSQRWPMQVVATASETAAIRGRAAPGQPLMAFVEDRGNPIKMRDDLPQLWASRPAGVRALGPAQRDEYYAFQLGVWGLASTDSVRVRFSALTAPGRPAIPATALDCITTDGIDWLGHPFHHDLKVDAGKVTPVWCGVMIPADAPPGNYSGAATVTSAAHRDVVLPLQFIVSAEVAVNHGDDDPSRLSRLRWLNSQLAADGPPTPPYTPVRAIPGGFAILGRTLQLDPVGLPRQISSLFADDLTLTRVPHGMLNRPFATSRSKERTGKAAPGWGAESARRSSARRAPSLPRRVDRAHSTWRCTALSILTATWSTRWRWWRGETPPFAMCASRWRSTARPPPISWE